MEWYAQTQEKLYADLESNPAGLSATQVLQKRTLYGENKLPEPKNVTYAEIFFRQFKSPLIYILLISAIIVFFLGDVEGGIVICIVLILNAIIGTIQEGKAQNTLRALKQFVKTQATVLREHIEIVIEDYEIVPGDIVLLKEGDKIPADARIISAESLKIDESSLTGESEPVLKNTKLLKDEKLPPQDQKNMVFKGTYVISGTASIIIVTTGVETMIGKISLKLESLNTDVPLKAQIKSLSQMLIIIVCVIVFIVFIIGIYSGITTKEMFGITVAIAVSAIPEGLPVVVTLILATSVSRMSKKNVLVKNLQSVEALGQADVIAVDKTGTVTLNQMMVSEVYVSSGLYQITGQGYEPKGTIEQEKTLVDYASREDLMLLGKIASLTSSAHIAFSEEKNIWQRISGDPTEVSLSVFAQKIGFDKKILETENPKLLEMPFNSNTRFHATVNAIKGKNMLFVAGAPEVLIESSEAMWTPDGAIAFNDEQKSKVFTEMENMSKKGLRVLALAVSMHSHNDISSMTLPKLSFVGFVGIEDAIRNEVYSAVEKARNAGIRVVMITGDHVATARAIAKTAGIYHEGDHILTGDDLTKLSPSELKLKIPHTSIFARVTPEDKLNIINAYKNAGLVIAMTGDGVNDALSLAAADLGVSMGKMGTEVAKEASDLVLLDDNFGNIVSAVEEGRHIYRTIKKVIVYLLSTGLGEIFAIAGIIILGLPMPFSATQIIWLNFITDGFLVVALAMEPSDKGILSKKIHKKDQKLINRNMILRMFIMGIIMMIGTIALYNIYKMDFIKASTIAVTVLAVYQWFNALNCRSDMRSIFRMKFFSNPYLIIALICVAILQILAVYMPWFNRFLGTMPISGYDWIIVIAVSLSVILVDEIYKIFNRSQVKLL